MNKNAIKKYATWARRELISRVSQKAEFYGVTAKGYGDFNADSIDGRVLSSSEKTQRQSLIHKVRSEGYEQVMEEVAYTWFNRFSALRYMEVNNYLPTRVRIFTNENGEFKPQIIDEAIHLEMDGLNMERVYSLKDANDTEALYRYLLITQCNALSKIMPVMFQKIDDYTELLLPDYLLREGSVIEQMVTSIPEEDWTDQVQIIGWLYQYYNAEKKDEVFKALKKNVKITKENIPAATQLFTPDWIVRYMVENSLGRLWVEGHPNEQLKSGWKYYLEEAEQEADVKAQLAEIRKEYAALKPEEILCIDPCAGSGHILDYLFDILMQIYTDYGYTTSEAVRSIIENNLYGLDIDDRAAQLAYFSVMMKARSYDRRFLTRKDEDGNPDIPQPHVYAIVESNELSNQWTVGNEQMRELFDTMRDAKEYGSILTVPVLDFDALRTSLTTNRRSLTTDKLPLDIAVMETQQEQVLALIDVAEALSQKYNVVVTNPPYMGSSGMSGRLSEFVKKNYTDSKSDLFACFIERGNSMTVKNGYNCMVTMQSWMFLSSFVKMRTNILTSRNITNLMHMENMVLGIAFGTAVTVFQNNHINGYRGTYNYIKLNDIENEKPKEFPVSGNRFAQVSTANFTKIPGSPVAYWASNRLLSAYEKGTSLGNIAFPKTGMTTGDNNRFLRLWHEIDINSANFSATSEADAEKSQKKWFPYCKGGGFKRWYGYNEYLVNWYNNGFEIKHNIKPNGLKAASVRSENMYFKPLITWSAVTSGLFSCRYCFGGALFDSGGSSISVTENPFYLLALLNSKVGQYILNISNATINYQPGDIAGIPVIFSNTGSVSDIAKNNIQVARYDWDAFETSWDFKKHPLIRGDKTKGFVIDAFIEWEEECNNRFNTLKANEEELNRIFIDIYGLQDELAPEVADKDVTVRKADLQREVKSLISYAVGCMFGRYSLDEDGLIYAGGDDWNDKFEAYIGTNGELKNYTFGELRQFKYQNLKSKFYYLKSENKKALYCNKVDYDNCIPITDEEYFEDDIVNRFAEFIETVYGKKTLEQNLKFIADALGGKGTPKQVIRDYFINDFYKDHCKIYQKRPIYWLFDSGKKNGFKCLIYMHRYKPDTIARIRTDYVHEQQSRYRTAITGLENQIAKASTGERVKLNKQLKKLRDQADELHRYEEKIHHLADQFISIDLDDGVKHNYEIFKDVLAKIK